MRTASEPLQLKQQQEVSGSGLPGSDTVIDGGSDGASLGVVPRVTRKRKAAQESAQITKAAQGMEGGDDVLGAAEDFPKSTEQPRWRSSNSKQSRYRW